MLWKFIYFVQLTRIFKLIISKKISYLNTTFWQYLCLEVSSSAHRRLDIAIKTSIQLNQYVLSLSVQQGIEHVFKSRAFSLHSHMYFQFLAWKRMQLYFNLFSLWHSKDNKGLYEKRVTVFFSTKCIKRHYKSYYSFHLANIFWEHHTKKCVYKCQSLSKKIFFEVFVLWSTILEPKKCTLYVTGEMCFIFANFLTTAYMLGRWCFTWRK